MKTELLDKLVIKNDQFFVIYDSKYDCIQHFIRIGVMSVSR